ncbi:protein disulfide-isomerase [Elysia marginata]|uniref:Protein disulfide-isomerase n=1 Tax=Elysia marginata TaxID=1093978 RepID=A0AAV4JFZ9_9GAST|nr:protein disulfide-isomerase [Elysia marginata]
MGKGAKLFSMENLCEWPLLHGHEELSVTTEHNVLKAFLTKQDTLLCALIKHAEINDSLEDIVAGLSQQPKFKKNIAGVINSTYDGQASKTSFNVQNELDRPSVLQCIIGHGFSSEISSPQSATEVSKWLKSLVKEALDKSFSVAHILVHPHSENARRLRGFLNLPLHSSILVATSSLNKKGKEVLIFKEKDIIAEKISVESFAHLSQIKHLNVTNFQWEAMTVKRSERFRPYIVIFYAWWTKHVGSYLRLLKNSVEEMQQLSIRARFALVNVAQEKKVISRYIDVRHFKSIPFIAVFQREKGKDTVNQTVIHLSHPSTFYLWQALREKRVWLYDAWDRLWEYSPYLTLDYTHPTLEKRMAKLKGIPILTEALWDAVMERSQISTESLNQETDIYITLLAFIQDGCGSCHKKMQTFQEVYKELRKRGNARLLMVNCSKDSSLCEDLGVKGFPTVSAFRSFAAIVTARCSIHPPEKPYLRRDYHGPISTDNLILWVESLSTNGVSFAGFTDIGDTSDMVDDVRLVATVIPKFSNYLPLAPGGERNYFYSPRCLRLACERLFGLASCHIVNSREIPPGEFTKANQGKSGMVVTEITFERRDGVSLSLMKLGKSILRLIEKETVSDLHLFHSPHQYSLGPKQTCEEDHDLCTQTIVTFVRDHLRLPVTQLTSEIFHTKNNPVFEVDKPVLIALSHAQNLTRTSTFMKLLEFVARRLYHNVTVTALDADQFPAWAGSFVPYHYPGLFMDSADGGPLHIYPRICLVTWKDHKRAAFYPPLQNVFNSTILGQLKLQQTDKMAVQPVEKFEEAERQSGVKLEDDNLTTKMDVTSVFSWDPDRLVSYVEAYLKNPDKFSVQTKHF